MKQTKTTRTKQNQTKQSGAKQTGTKQNSKKKENQIMNAAYLAPAITLFNEDGTLDLASQERLYNNLI